MKVSASHSRWHSLIREKSLSLLFCIALLYCNCHTCQIVHLWTSTEDRSFCWEDFFSFVIWGRCSIGYTSATFVLCTIRRRLVKQYYYFRKPCCRLVAPPTSSSYHEGSLCGTPGSGGNSRCAGGNCGLCAVGRFVSSFGCDTCDTASGVPRRFVQRIVHASG